MIAALKSGRWRSGRQRPEDAKEQASAKVNPSALLREGGKDAQLAAAPGGRFAAWREGSSRSAPIPRKIRGGKMPA
jgi:hypothetical protein